MKNNLKVILSLLAIVIVALYIKTNWQYWTQNEQQWKITCTFPVTKGHIQTVSDYRDCLANRHIAPNDTDIRKMCYYYSRDEYFIQTGKYPDDTTLKEDNLYKACLHEQGLPE
ncbi:MAG TPA: hypothetical protein VF810_00265 [Patescibacteria group bacterium]